MILFCGKVQWKRNAEGVRGSGAPPHCAARGPQMKFAALLRRPGPGGFAAGPQ